MPHPVNYWTGERYYRPYRMPYNRQKQKRLNHYELREQQDEEIEEVKQMSDKQIIWHELYWVTGR